jgi:hypothetical protein
VLPCVARQVLSLPGRLPDLPPPPRQRILHRLLGACAREQQPDRVKKSRTARSQTEPKPSHALHAARTLGRRRLHRRGHRVRAGLRCRRRRPPSRGRLHRSWNRRKLIGMSPRRFPIPVYLARIEMGWLLLRDGCGNGGVGNGRYSTPLHYLPTSHHSDNHPIRCAVSVAPAPVSVRRRVWGRMRQRGGCQGKRPGPALGSPGRSDRGGSIRRSRPFGPKRTTPRGGRSGPPAGTARHGSFCCVKKGIGAGRDICNVAESGQCHRSLFASRYATPPGSRKPGFGIVWVSDPCYFFLKKK